jgi:hypothetical protein
VTQVVGPEFKPDYHKKKIKEDLSNKHVVLCIRITSRDPDLLGLSRIQESTFVIGIL